MLCAALALVAIVIGITAVIADEAVLGLAAAVVGVAAAGVGALVDVRRTRAEASPVGGARPGPTAPPSSSTRCRPRSPRSRLLAASRPEPSPDLPARRPTPRTGRSTRSPASSQRHFPVLVQQVVAAARRKVQPVSVVIWELDGLDGAEPRRSEQALDRARARSCGARCARATPCAASATSSRWRCSSTPPSPGTAWSPSACASALHGRARSATRSPCRPGSRATRRTRSTPPSSSRTPDARSSSRVSEGHDARPRRDRRAAGVPRVAPDRRRQRS